MSTQFKEEQSATTGIGNLGNVSRRNVSQSEEVCFSKLQIIKSCSYNIVIQISF